MSLGEFSIGPQSLAVSRSLVEAFNFRLMIDGLGSTNFSKVGELKMEFGIHSYREAGATLPVKDPEFIEFDNFVLERGVSFEPEIYNWCLRAAQRVMGTTFGRPVVTDKRNATLYQYTRDKQIAKRWQIYGAFPVSFVSGTWNNNEDQVLIETLTLAYDFFEIISE
jgi:phage tail-like protein